MLDFLAQALAAPYSAEPNTDATAVVSLEKLSGNTSPTTTVGDYLSEPLAVRALDRNGRPVIGAAIKFWITRGAGGLGPDATNQFTVETDAAGIARVAFRSGENTALNPLYVKPQRTG